MFAAVPAGKQIDRSTISYEAPGDMTTRIMGVFLALGSIAFAFGDTILPEIQVAILLLHAACCMNRLIITLHECTTLYSSALWCTSGC